MTLEQQRAAKAYAHVTGLPEALRPPYSALAHELPALLRSAGLCQALHFLKSRAGGQEGGTASPRKTAARRLLEHLAEQLQRLDPAIAPDDGGASLCSKVREAELVTYLWLTREALATSTWYARLAQSELGYVPGTDVDRGGV